MEILIDRLTNNVAGLNCPATPLNITVKVDDGFTLSKTIEEVVGEKPLTDADGNQLYRLPSSKELTTEETPFHMVESIKELRTITLETKPEVFTLEEVIEAKYKDMLNNSSCDFVMADMFIDESDLDLNDVNNSANTGVGILQLLPKGQAKTKSTDLETATTNFTLLEFDADPGVEIYVAGKLFTDRRVDLTTQVNSCTIKFVNTTDKPKMIRAYAIGY